MRLIHKLKQYRQIFFFLIGKYPAKLTDNNELTLLLNKLKPIHCGKKLIRLGPNGDGGYLVPDDLDGIKACFSPGVAFIADFEMDCAAMGMKVFLADKSVEHLPKIHKLFHFTKKYVGAITNDDFMTIDDWVVSYMPNPEDELLLQMDIEGYEYEVFLAMSEQLLRRFRIIVVEFHNLEEFLNKPFFNLSSRVFDKLLQTHSCVHNHPNNCCGQVTNKDITLPKVTELTFIRNDRINNPSPVDKLPHPLDCHNTENPPLNLPKCWYG